MTSRKEKNNTEISARLTKMLTDAGISPNHFASRLEYTRAQTIYDVLNGKSAPSYDFFKRFMLSEYSAIYDIDWLLTGRGSMLRDERPVATIEPTVIYKSDPKDAELLAAKDEVIAAKSIIIERDAEVITSLRNQVKELETKLHDRSVGLGSAPAADTPSVGGCQTSPK